MKIIIGAIGVIAILSVIALVYIFNRKSKNVGAMNSDDKNLLPNKKKYDRQCLIDGIKEKVDELALIINAPRIYFPTYDVIKGDGTPCVQVDKAGFMYYVISERGNEYERKLTDNPDDLFYWIFEHITFDMASDYELNNRIADKDSRRIMFSKQEELLGQLNETWKGRIQAEHRNILESYPFDDLARLRATYYRELRQEGYSETAIEKIAYEKYPKN